MTYVMDKLDNTAPVAAFTYEADKLSVSLTDASTDAENDALTYYWNFGNGTSSTEKNPSVTYDEAGTYIIALTVTDARGAASRTVSQSVTVSDRTVIDQTRGSLCYAGTSNSWTFDQMTYNESPGYWTVTVNLDGSASQRFKVVDGCSWSGSTIYGSSGVAGQLTVNTSTSGDEYTSLSGIYTLKVKDADMSYSFENVQ